MVEIASGRRRGAVLSTLHARIQDAFNEHGVQILSPRFEMQPGQPVVVPRERWSPPPAVAATAPGRPTGSTVDGSRPATG